MGVTGQTKSAVVPLDLAVFYDDAGPVYLQYVNGLAGSIPCAKPPTPGQRVGPGAAWNTSPNLSLVSKDSSRVGGWLGRDPNGNMAWVLSYTPDYSEYLSVWSMPQAPQPGKSIPLTCQ